MQMTPPQSLQVLNFTVPADISSAAFFLVAATLIPGSEICLTRVNVNPTRTGVLDVLQSMGADIQIQNQQSVCGEPVADLRVRASALNGTVVAGDLIPRLIDEIPILALAGLMAKGRFEVCDASELKVKETDRIQAIVSNLQKCNAAIVAQEDGFVIEGGGTMENVAEEIPTTEIWQTFADHRIAMMGVITNAVLGTSFQIDDVECIRTSFPNFFEILKSLGRS